MFDVLFGWRKASKCKKLIKLLHCRLNLLKRKRFSIVRQLREDIAQLLKIGQNEAAFARAEQVLKDQSLLDAYDLVDRYCEFIYLHFPYIRRHKDRPKDINEAVSTLIFAAAWFGDLPELRVIRKLFGKRYGQKFVKDVAALQSGNLVDHEIMEKLCPKFISDGVKLKLINEIAIDYGLQLWYWGCDNKPKQHLLQMPGNTDHQLERFVFEGEAGLSCKNTGGAMVLASYAKHSPDIPSELIIHLPEKAAPMHKRAVHTENHSQYKYMYELPDQSDFESSGSKRMPADSFEGNADTARTGTPEISLQYPKRTDYVDEVEELEFNGDDKSLFLFNTSLRPLIDNYAVVGGSTLLALSHHGYSEGNCSKPKPEDKIALSRKTHGRIRNSYGHRLERRVDTMNNHEYESFLTPLNMKDNDCVVFNGQFCNISPYQKQFYHRISQFQNKPRTMMPAKKANFSVSSQLELSKGNAASSCGHVHPKLPDYDEIAAQFKALKKDHRLRTNA